jgi:GH15 family glucan-1,4-alpha-glucosidase
MYGVMGERRLQEWEVPWLPGYEAASPVRMGNAAHAQFQLDIYGEVMDAFEHARRGSLAHPDEAWAIQCTLLDHLAKVWPQPDQGVWEMRGAPQHFTFSKVMSWVAFDRGICGVERHGLEGPVAEWRAVRDQIRADILAHGYNAAGNHFQLSYEDAGLDAALLLLAPVGFIVPDDPRYVGTVAAIERELVVDGFVHRYNTQTTEDGLPAGEAAFIACTCWLADAYVMLGRMDQAEAVFNRVLAIRNDLGLLAEEYDVTAKRQAGNFPQAFSHVALVNTALNLTRATKPVGQRAAQ